MKFNVNGVEQEIDDSIVEQIKESAKKEELTKNHVQNRSQVWETAKQDILDTIGKKIDVQIEEGDKFKDVLSKISKTMDEFVAKKVEKQNPDDINLYKEELKKEIEGEYSKKIKEAEETYKKKSLYSELVARGISGGLKDQYKELFESVIEKNFDINFDQNGSTRFRDLKNNELIYIDDKPAGPSDIVDKIFDQYPDLRKTPKVGNYGETGQYTQEQFDKLPLERRMEHNLAKLKIV